MSKAIYIDGLQIERDLESSDDFAVFEGIMSSDKLNTKYFRWSTEALEELTRQANEGNGVPIYPLHRNLWTSLTSVEPDPVGCAVINR